MKLKLFLAAIDRQDGSMSVSGFNTRKEALKNLNRTKKQLEHGNFYEDGEIQEVELDVTIKGKTITLNKPILVSFGD